MLADLAGSVANCKGAQHSAFESTKHQQQGIWLQPRTAWRCVRFGTQFSKPSRRFWGCSATSLPEDQPDKASTQRHKALAKQALKSLEDAGKIGSEYGEGFVEFRIGAQPLHLDVDTLNERLKVQGANRMRHAMRPDEAYGMVFSLDNVIVNTRTLQHKAWQKIAQEEGLELPSMERQIYDVRPERAITEVCTATCFIQGEMLLPLSAFLCIFICIYHLMAAYKSAISCHISLPFGCVTEMVCA
ncbi:hypothetical protein ABBQ32_009347 [Trebouxia sp. C0010 RCD-2024]